MKEKPYRVTMTYLKNVAKRHRPPVYEEQSKDETFWGLSAAEAERKCLPFLIRPYHLNVPTKEKGHDPQAL